MQRIVLVGPPGSGKSTLARSLATTLSLPLVERDALPPLGSPEYRAAVSALLSTPSWIFDGFPYFADEVYSAADMVIALRLSRSLTLPRLLRRSLALLCHPSGGHPRAPLSSWLHTDHALRTALTQHHRRIQEIDTLPSRPELSGASLVVLSSSAEIRSFLASLSSPG